MAGERLNAQKGDVMRLLEVVLIAAALCAAPEVGAVAVPKAIPVWAEGRAAERDLTLGFRVRLDDGKAALLRYSASSIARVWLNGEFLCYGPARGPHGLDRVDEIPLAGRMKPGENILAFEVAGYNVPNFYLMEQPPFFKAAVSVNGKAAAVSGRDFRAWRLPRVQKAPRFSFQRTFAEIYDVPGREIGPLDLVAAPEPTLIDRIVPYPDYEVNDAPTPVSFADVRIDPSCETHADRSLALPGQKDSGFKGFRMEDLTLNSAYLAQRLAYANRRAATESDRAAKSFDLSAGKSVAPASWSLYQVHGTATIVFAVLVTTFKSPKVFTEVAPLPDWEV